MLFRKKMPRSCYYCRNGGKLEDDTILCTKKGFLLTDTPCRKFKYDPCKRIPPRPRALDFSKYDQEDFSL